MIVIDCSATVHSETDIPPFMGRSTLLGVYFCIALQKTPQI